MRIIQFILLIYPIHNGVKAIIHEDKILIPQGFLTNCHPALRKDLACMAFKVPKFWGQK